MNSLMNVPKNGSLATKRRTSNFPLIDSLMDDWFFNDLPSFFSSNFNTGITLPKVNIRETAESYFVDMAVPGMQKSDFKVDLDNQVLTISCERAEEDENTDQTFTRREFGYSSFKRTFNLPETVEEDKIEAIYDNGILSIELPKREEAKQKPPRSIDIK